MITAVRPPAVKHHGSCKRGVSTSGLATEGVQATPTSIRLKPRAQKDRRKQICRSSLLSGRVFPLLYFFISFSECLLVFALLSTVNRSCSEFPDFPDAILMYAVLVACCLGESVSLTTGQTDGRTPDRYITLSARRGVKWPTE